MLKEIPDNSAQEPSAVFTFETVIAPESAEENNAMEEHPSAPGSQEQMSLSSPTASSDTECSTVWKTGQSVGKYEIIRKIGRGGMGEIYLARHRQLDSLRALKVLTGSHGSDPIFLERFLREARMASRIRHPNVVEVMDVEHDSEKDLYYIVMEYVDGGSLRQILKRQRLTLEQSAVIIRGVAAALCVAVSHKIVHRDIKPDNIMFTRSGVVKLTDLGIAKSDVDDVSLTRTNVMIGTPAYLSPEQIDNPKMVDIRTDIYSLGATFYEMLTGQTPYPGKTTYDIMRKLFSDPVPDPRVLNPDVPPEISALIMKMLAKNANERFREPAELLDALAVLFPPLTAEQTQHIIQGLLEERQKGGVSSDISKITKSFYTKRSRAKRKKMIWLSLGAGLAMILGGLFVLLFRNLSSGEQTPVPMNESQTLSIRTTPHADVFLISADGRSLQYIANDQGAVVISDLQTGKYQLEIRRTDFCDYVSDIWIPHAEELTILLKPDLKKLSISAQPGARITLFGNGIEERQYQVPSSGEIHIFELKRGFYSVKCMQEGFLPVEKTLLLDQNESISINMESVYKSILIQTAPSAKIELRQNGTTKHRGSADASGRCLLSNIRKGIYEIEVSEPSYQKYSSVITVEKDLTSKIALSPISVSIPKQNIEAPLVSEELRYGTITIDCVGDEALLNYVKTAGIEVQINNEAWILVKKFPCQHKCIVGEAKVRIRSAYIYPVFPETVQVRDGGSSQYTTVILAKPSEIFFSSNQRDTVFRMNGQTCSIDTSVDVSAFRSYTIEAISEGVRQQKTLYIDRPNAKFQAEFFFAVQVHPGEDEYKKGMELFEKQEYTDALKLLESAAQKHHAPAALKVAEFHEKGLGSFLRLSNHKEALKWLDIAAESGDPGAAFQVAEAIRNENMDGSMKKMMDYYLLASKHKIAQAAYIMASIYRNGYKTIPPNKQLMIKYLEVATEYQYPDAMYELGFCYEQGDGVVADNNKAIRLIKKAAAAGNDRARRYLPNEK